MIIPPHIHAPNVNFQPASSKRTSTHPRKRRFAVLALFLSCLLLTSCNVLKASNNWLEPYELTWTRTSRNAGESMPCGGGDIGLNVWVDNGDILIYMAKSDAIDEVGLQPKIGRLRIRLSPNPFTNHTEFSQNLNLREGCVEIFGENYGMRSKVTVWVDVKRPVINIDVASNQKSDVVVSYENWHQDDVTFVANKTGILFYHQNLSTKTCFDQLIHQQGLTAVNGQLNNPLKDRIYGGLLRGTNMTSDSLASGRYAGTDYMGLKLKSIKPATRHKLEVVLHAQKAEVLDEWEAGLAAAIKDASANVRTARKASREWWERFWERSFIRIGDEDGNHSSKPWLVGRDYQMYRYLMACNAGGSVPTNANGGMFSYDPPSADSLRPLSPDFRRADEKGFTAKRQLLLHWPLLKSGDFDLLKPQLDFYLKNWENAEIRTKTYWGHDGAFFTEQMELFGLPVETVYGSGRPTFYDPGVEYDRANEYLWDNALGFCLMMLDEQQHTRSDSTNYIPFIESCLRFFDNHYQYLSERRTLDKLDGAGHLILYPGTAGDTYKMATNSTSTVAGLRTVIDRLLKLDSAHLPTETRQYVEGLSSRIPPLTFRERDSCKVIAPAKSYERMSGTGMPQLTPVFPYSQFGIGRSDLQVAIDTWKKGYETSEQRQDLGSVYCARLGLQQEATDLTLEKLGLDSTNLFPIFRDTIHDGTPDLAGIGSGVVGLQEMLLQTNGDSIYLFPAWPREWDVTFKLHAPLETTIEATWKGGKLENLSVTPIERRQDIVNCLDSQP